MEKEFHKLETREEGRKKKEEKEEKIVIKATPGFHFGHMLLWENDDDAKIRITPKKTAYRGCLSSYALPKVRRHLPLVDTWFVYVNIFSSLSFTLVHESMTTSYWFSIRPTPKLFFFFFNLVFDSLRFLQFNLEFHLNWV